MSTTTSLSPLQAGGYCDWEIVLFVFTLVEEKCSGSFKTQSWQYHRFDNNFFCNLIKNVLGVLLNDGWSTARTQTPI